MFNGVHELYQSQRYPALSHPGTHPARLAVAAQIGGLKNPAAPSSARVLEMGCSSGHNLLPLAERFPQSFFLGLDLSEAAISAARQSAEAVGLENIRFEVADLATWQPVETFDYIIAHGVFSWVPDGVKERVLSLCAAALKSSGVASIGYNTLPGWSLRQGIAPLIQGLARSPEAPLGGEVTEVIRQLASLSGSATPYAAHLQSLLGNMQKKGAAILGFDDFAPVCDPVYFSQFVDWAAGRGLSYLGESDLAENLPENITPETLEGLGSLRSDHVMFQQTLDLLSGRTHRSSLLCRHDAPRDPRLSTAVVLDFSVVADRGDLPIAPTAAAAAFRSALVTRAPLGVVPRHFLIDYGSQRADAPQDARDVVGWIFQLAQLGHVSLRVASPDYVTGVPSQPQLSALNLHFAKQALPVVDAWHVSCHFPAGYGDLLARMDGSRDLAEIAAQAREVLPDLDFPRWVAHLARRGLFV